MKYAFVAVLIAGLFGAALPINAQVQAREGSYVSDPNSPWEAAPIAAQVPGSTTRHSGTIDRVALWFERGYGVLNVQPDVDSFAIHCGIAGQEGPVVWDTAHRLPESYWWIDQGRDARNQIQIREREILPAGRSASCDATVNDIPSLLAAARKRLLYIEYVKDGERRRGQFWPRNAHIRATGGFVSLMHPPEQGTPSLWFSEDQATLDRVRWGRIVQNGAADRRPGVLTCSPAGEEGEVIVAILYRGRGEVTNADITPTDGMGQCGMVINNVASLLEATLQGRIGVGGSHRFNEYHTPARWIKLWLDW